GFHKDLNDWFNNGVSTGPTAAYLGNCVAPRLNGAAFCNPLIGQFGNSARNIIRGPGINNFDVGIGKTFSYTERIGFQFRAEAFNVFNHHQYGFDPFTSTGIASPVGNNPTGPAFGQVTAARPGRILQFGGKVTF